VLTGVMLHHQLADWEHVGSFITGYALGRMLGVAPATGLVRRRLGPFGSSLLRPAIVALPVLVVATIAGSMLGIAIVPARSVTVPVASGTTSPRLAATPARLVDVVFPTPSIGGARHAIVLLPNAYDATRAKYPVIEMLHGSPGVPSDILLGFDPLTVAARADIPAYIGVVPDGRGPVIANGEFADTSKQRLGSALSTDLRRWINQRFRTNGHWGVMGLSAGGYGAAYLASRAGSGYDSVCSLSGNFTPQGPAFRSESRQVLDLASPILWARRDGPRTLLVSGSSDRGSLQESLVYASALSRARQPYQRVVVPGGHDWTMWGREFPRCLQYMLKNQGPQTTRTHPPRISVKSASAIRPPTG